MASTAALGDVYPMQPLMLAQLSLPTPSGLAPGARPTVDPSMPPGLYVQVIDGLINVINKGGAQNFAAGQFGYTPSPTQPPVIVPKNPGIQFTLPPGFVIAMPPAGSTTTTPKSNTVDCEVR
jgi:hypothetical protein